MDRSIMRIGIAVGIALLALAMLGLAPLSPTLASFPLFPGVEGERIEPPPTSPVCFWSAQGLVCVERAAGPEPEELLAALLAGPTPQERARGLWSAIPDGTTLEELEVQADRTVIVRLGVPLESLLGLDHTTFEIIVNQIGWTLEPLDWRDLRIQTWDLSVGEFVPLAAFLPEIPAPRKETVLTGEEGLEIAPAYTGQPPAPGQGQPQGTLSGKTVYVSAGHGWEWDYDGRCDCDRWKTQRPVYQEFIEDHNNAEAVNQYLLQYLWNAGAQVWPVRERDMNSAEVVVDNDNPISGTGYLETGTWATESGTGYAGGDYHWAATDTPTATAVWTTTLPADGEYAVYIWYRPGSDRAPDARYTVHHSGGETTVIVNQQHHGLTWHYIGTYGFRAGEEARIALTNQSSVAGRVVVADAVRFGGGTFDDLTGIQTDATGPPNKPWWEMAAYYYVQRMGMSQQMPGDVTARPIYARWEHAGTGDDSIYVSWHTNGWNGTVRGTETYAHNSETLTRTEGSLELRHAIHTEVVNDIRAGWDPTWTDRGEKVKNLGELRLLWDEDESVRMPGALTEIAFHDNPDDADALKEPAFQLLAARALYQGIVKYFEQRDGLDLPLLPEPPTHLAVQNVGSGQARISWRPSPTDTVGLVGDAATGYRVYTSTDGLGWSNRVVVTETTVCTLTGLSPGQLLFVRVTAANDGGESFTTETLGVRVGDDAGVLLANGFDRLNRTMLVPETDPVEGYNLRMFLSRMNRYDYAIQHGQVISYPFDSASNKAVQAGMVSLGDYALVDWILGEESAPDETLDAKERALLEAFLDGGGALFLSGTEVGWHLDHLEGDPDFYNSVLRADYVGDDAETYEVNPVTGSIFEGLASFQFDAQGMYDADYPDELAPINGSVAALTYNTGMTAAIQYADGCERLAYFGFPFETIWPDQRPAVMARVLDFLDECLELPVNTNIVAPTYGSVHSIVPPFEGTSEVYSGTLQRVEVQVERVSDGYYWTGSDWNAAQTWLTATGTVTWSYDLPSLSDDGSDDSDYHLRARAWTTDGYSDTSPATVVFTYDTISPTSTTLITPTGGVVITTATVSLAWQPVAPDGGSPLAYVVDLDGQPYTTTQSMYTVTHVSHGMHTWAVQVFDAAGNRSGWITDTFFVNCYRRWLPLVAHNFESGGNTCTDVLVNGGFESDEGWVLNLLATYNNDSTYVHSGAWSMQVGIPEGEPGGGAPIYSSVSQQVTLTAGTNATLSLWIYCISEGNDSGDQHYITLYDQWGGHHVLDTTTTHKPEWVPRQYDLSPYLGQTVTLYIGAKNDGDDDTAALYVDDVMLEICP